jgi:GNAT superfamily N-acetyltransferase
VHIRRVALDDPQEFRRYYGVWRAADRIGRTRAATPSLDEARGLFDDTVATGVLEGYAGFVADTLVSAGYIDYSTVDNLDLAGVHVSVEPSVFGQGFGSAMLGDLIDRCRMLGRHTLLSRSWVPIEQREDHPYLRFAAKHCFSVANVEVRRVLELPIAAERIDRWRSQSAPYHADYRLATFVGEVPTELVPSLCQVMSQLGVESPTGEIELEARAITPEVYEARERRAAAAGKQVQRVLAIGHGHQVVGFTTMAIPLHEPDVVYQYGTLVRREHRGHRLGMAMKAAALVALQERFPDRTHVETLNAEQNGPMIDINDKIGFRPQELRTAFQRILRDSDNDKE